MTTTTQQQQQRGWIRERMVTAMLLFIVSLPSLCHAGFQKEEKKCSIFIAPSSLLGNSGFGVYTTRDIGRGDDILQAPDGPALPVIDPNDHHAENEAYNLHKEHWNAVFGHYWWGRGLPEHVVYEAEQVMDFQITFGALPNHHCILGSLEMHFPETDAYDDSLTPRFTSPGAGAYSYHTGRVFFATHALAAGSEIFLSYGYCSRHDKDNPEDSALWYPEWTEYIPMRDDFELATEATTLLWNTLVEQHKNLPENIPNDVPLEFPDTVPSFKVDSEGVVSPSEEPLTAHARALLPKTTTQLKHIMTYIINIHDDTSEDEQYEILTRYLAREFGTTPRTPEWVHQHGLCIEHLIPGPSTIPHAGRGAMAQHFIAAGDMVVPVPLLHIAHKDVLHLLNHDGEITEFQQVLVNYCFSHVDSTLALCPTSNAILLNHCSKQNLNCKPNARIQWANENWDPRTQVWLNATVEEMETQVDRLLAIEVIATRDIQPGEEVFLDYGDEWEQAWQHHVENWTPDLPDEEEFAFSIAEANRDLTAPLEEMVSGSIWEEVNHPYIFTACLYWPTDSDDQEVYHEPASDLEDLTDLELLERYADDGSHYRGDYSESHLHQQNWWPCSVLYQDNEEDADELTYLVRITQHLRVDPPMPWDEHELPRYLYNYPRSSIRYFAKPYLGDQFLFNAFRHFIPIADDMFPQQWRNLLQETNTTPDQAAA